MGKRVKSEPKRNDSFRFNVGLGKKKKDNNIKAKISSNRMTILPGFLSYGVKSEVAKKDEKDPNKNHENILKEDLHSLFMSNYQENSSLRRSSRISQKNPSVRRSSRISQQKETTYSSVSSENPKRISKTDKEKIDDYPIEILNQCAPNTPVILPRLEENSQKNSKSLFKKLISSQAFFSSSSFLKLLLPTKTQDVAKDFNQNLLDKIHIHFRANILGDLRNKIFEEINKVNDILTGKSEPTQTMGSFKKLTHENTDNDHEVPEYLFNSKDWQYATPPSQKLNITLYEESAIQPAIFCEDGTGRNIYKLKKNVDPNLINHINPDNIEVDNRYMEQIAEFDKENRPLRNFFWNEQNKQDDLVNQAEGFNFKPQSVNQFLRDHSTTIHARPKKTVKRLRFLDAFNKNEFITLSRGRELSKPSTSAVPDAEPMDTSELDFTFVNCLTDDSSYESPRKRFKMVQKVNFLERVKKEQHAFNDLSISDDE